MRWSSIVVFYRMNRSMNGCIVRYVTRMDVICEKRFKHCRHYPTNMVFTDWRLMSQKDVISSLILKYNEYGFLDQLHRKWYGRIHCMDSSALTKPKPLTVKAVAGVFLMLFFGLVIGSFILLIEHFVFKYILPSLRKKPKECFWKSPNLMFFSQVSPHSLSA